MKTTFILFVFILLENTSFCQKVNYETVTINKWTFEKFPKIYLVKPTNILTKKDRFTGKLIFYQEVNELGQPYGLTVELQDDNVSPATVYYYNHEAGVYQAEFFLHSKKAQTIINRNLKDQFDGPQITRDLNYNDNSYSEKIKMFKNGEDLSVKKYPTKLKFNTDNLLDGYFYNGYSEEYRYGGQSLPKIIKGIAHNGKLLEFSINDSITGNHKIYRFRNNLIYITRFTQTDSVLSIRMITSPVDYFITNSNQQDNSNKRYFYVNTLQENIDLEETFNSIFSSLTECEKISDSSNVCSFKNDLLEGKFNGISCDENVYEKYSGNAVNGIINKVHIFIEQKKSGEIFELNTEIVNDSLYYQYKDIRTQEVANFKNVIINKIPIVLSNSGTYGYRKFSDINTFRSKIEVKYYVTSNHEFFDPLDILQTMLKTY